MPRKDTIPRVDIQLWERQPGETARAYEAFCAYRDLGPDRNLTEAAKKLGVSHTATWKKSAAFNWRPRAYAYDVYLDAKARVESEKEIVRMRARHARLGFEMTAAAGAGLKRLQKIYETSGGLLELAPADIARLAAEGAKLESLARGEPTEITRNTLAEVPLDDPASLDLLYKLQRIRGLGPATDAGLNGRNGHARPMASLPLPPTD